MNARIKRDKNVYKALSPVPDIAEARWIVAVMMKENEEKQNTTALERWGNFLGH